MAWMHISVELLRWFAENDEIVTMLRGMGIDYAQGYGISEPKPILKSADTQVG